MSMKTMDLILVILGVLTIIFTITMIWLFYTRYAVPDTLITCFFAAVTGECGFMGLIKATKVRHEDRKWSLEDEKRWKEDQKKMEENYHD